MKTFRFDWFMQGMVLMVVLAFIWPAPGAHGGVLQPEWLNKIGVAVVFFLNGLGLSLASMRDGALRWRVHLLVQLSTFVLFPLLGVLIVWTTRGWLSPELQIGFFYLCALPSTVSSSVALTVAARGNVPAAVFNATLSSLIGVVITPMWMAWMLGHSGAEFPVMPVIIDLLRWVVLPLALGQVARNWLAAWAITQRKRIQVVDRLTILMLIYTSFADSVQQGIWSRYGAWPVVESVVGALLLFGVVLACVRALSTWIGLSLEDRVAAVFCGSKKTLAAGVPMAHLIFGTHPAIGLILMPLMLYHPLQLAVGGVLAQRWAARPAA
ncbi:MAG: bile acid:sodium symporter family protein [Leptothrix sp. (in: b-proteobacteria)]